MNMRAAEILWDDADVPHIYADSDASLFYAFAWAQMRNHGNLVLRLYAQARASAAGIWGPRYLGSDRWVATMGVPERAASWLCDQSPEFRGALDAFAEGINDYARAHAQCLSAEAREVLPVTAVDVLAHGQRVVNFSFVVDPYTVLYGAPRERRFGSNSWALGPSRTADGNSMLLVNPHLPWGEPWGEMFVCFEAHLCGPSARLYGMALVGFPVLAMAFNDDIGWAHTVNTYTGWTRYALDVAHGGYRFDGAEHRFEVEHKMLNVRQIDGSVESAQLTVRRSVHGPVFELGGTPIAIRVAGLDRPCALEQWWQMGCARNLGQFEAALARLQIPMFSVMYADRDGHIMHVFNGNVPVREHGDAAYWNAPVPGDRTATLWTRIHAYEELPRVIDPPSGWLQNANDPPWTTTFPRALEPNAFPPYFAPRGPMGLRAQMSARLMMGHGRWSLEEFVSGKFSTVMELANRVCDELVCAARAGSATARAAAEVLSAWDRASNAESRGAVLFAAWANAVGVENIFEVPWDERKPLATPRRLRDPKGTVRTLERVATEIAQLYGAADVAWGDVFRLETKGTNVPAIGADLVGSFTELWYVQAPGNQFIPVGGECYVAAIEFASPVRAMVINAYGNATEPVSARPGRQLESFARKELRPALLERTEIQQRAVKREELNYCFPSPQTRNAAAR